METPSELPASVERAYHVFAGYGRHLSHVTADDVPSCHALKQQLEATKLREQSAARLNHCCWIDDERGFKHFLPRMFELMAQENEPRAQRMDTFYVALMLNRYRPALWPKDERAAVEKFFGASFLARLRRGDALFDPLLEFAMAFYDLEPLLRLWDRESSRAATVALARFIIDEWRAWDDRLKALRFEPPLNLASQQLRDWLRATAVKQRLEAAYLSAPDAPDAESLAYAVDWLSTLL